MPNSKFFIVLLLLGIVALLAVSLELFPPPSKEAVNTTSQNTQLVSECALDAVAIQRACASKPDSFTCYKQAFEKIVSQIDTQQALAVLEQVAARDRSVLSRAHDYAHAIGKFSFGHYKDAPKAFSLCKDLFASGCYHGVLEGYLSSTPQVAPEDIATLCGTEVQTKQTEFVRFQCLHGLGHGLTMHFEHDILKALEYCDFLRPLGKGNRATAGYSWKISSLRVNPSMGTRAIIRAS